MNYNIAVLPSGSEDITEMSASLHQELELMYGKGSIEDFIEENKEMLIFYAVRHRDNGFAACGALKHFNGETAEIKRMYVKGEHRGKGLSKLILKQLEETAAGMNYKRIILETGTKQPEAMNLYEKAGYSKIEAYGRHKDDPDSVCYEKKIE